MYQCKYCNNNFVAKQKNYSTYCSISCANKDKPRRLPEGQCRICLKSIKTIKSFCSSECKLKFKELKTIERNKNRSLKISQFRRNQKQKAVEYKGGKCQMCGYFKSNSALSFHHLDPTQKEFNLSSKGICKSWEKVKTELDKCILLCMNCHAEEHDNLRK